VAVVGGLTAVVVVQQRANKELAAEQAKVEARFKMAADSIELFHTVIDKEPLLQNPGFKELRTKLLKEAARFYVDLEKLLKEQTDAKSRRTLAEGYFQLADLTGKIGDQKQALAVHQKGLALRRELAAAPGADVETRLDVARSLRKVGGYLFFAGDPAGALRALEEMRDIAAALEAETPTDAVRLQLARSHNSIGLVLFETGKPAEGLAMLARALVIRQKLVDANPDNIEFKVELAECHNNNGWCLVRGGKPAEALEPFRTALATLQELGDAHPRNADYKYRLVQIHGNLGRAFMRSRKPAEALEPFRERLASSQKLVAEYPAVNQYRVELESGHFEIGWALYHMGKPAEALKEYRAALAINQKLRADDPEALQYKLDLANIHNNIGNTLHQVGKPAEGLESLRTGLAIQEKVVDANADTTIFKDTLAGFHEDIGMKLVNMGKPAEALESFRKSLPIRQKLVDANSANPAFQESLVNLHTHIGRARGRQKQFAEAFTAFGAGRAIQEKLAEASPGWHAYRGAVRARAGQPAEAAADLRRALELWGKDSLLDTEAQFDRSQAQALLAGLGADAKSGVTRDEAKKFADQSVAALAALVKLGWALPSELKEPDFDALRGRAEFQKLVAAVEAKAEKVPETAPPEKE
jgi:tetratricopeptide (TPR) repeat protein